MRKSIRIVSTTLYFLLIATTLFADWELQTPGIAGGPLTARQQAGMVSIGKGRVILFGGRNGSTNMNDTWLYETNKNRWTILTPNMVGYTIESRYAHGMAYLGWESLLLYGGYGGFTDTLIYNFINNSWTRLTPTYVNGTPPSLHSFGMCYIDEGRVLMFGGQYFSSNLYNNTYIYNASLNQWQHLSLVGESPSSRAFLGMAYIGNGQAIMFGGQSGSTYYNDTWVFNLAQNQWTNMNPAVIGGTLSGRSGFGMTYIGGDRVLLFGGALSSTTKTNEIWVYDLSDNRWTNLTPTITNTMPAASNVRGFTSIGLGQVVMFGGSTTSGTVLNETWRFSVPNNIQDSLDWQTVPSGIQLSWALPETLAAANFSVYRDGMQISSSATQGTAVDGMIPLTFLDPNPATNRIYRYQIKETYPVINTELFYPEIDVPYCQ